MAFPHNKLESRSETKRITSSEEHCYNSVDIYGKTYINGKRECLDLHNIILTDNFNYPKFTSFKHSAEEI